MFRKLISLILCFAILFLLSCPVFASESNSAQYTKDGIIYFDYSSESELSEDQACAYKQYEVNQPPTLASSSEETPSTKDFILSQSTLQSSYALKNRSVKEYASNTLSQYLYQCKEIWEITQIDDNLHVTYLTDDDTEVRLVYSDSQLTEKVIYFPSTDTAIIDVLGSCSQHNNFRHGQYSEVSEELMEQIETLYRNNDWEALEALGCVDTEIEPLYDTIDSSTSTMSSASTLYGFTSDAAMLANLKQDFPIQNSISMLTQSMHYDYDYSTIASNALSLYSKNVYADEYCSLYFPD